MTKNGKRSKQRCRTSHEDQGSATPPETKLSVYGSTQMHDAVLKQGGTFKATSLMGTFKATSLMETEQHHFRTWARMPDNLGNASAA